MASVSRNGYPPGLGWQPQIAQAHNGEWWPRHKTRVCSRWHSRSASHSTCLGGMKGHGECCSLETPRRGVACTWALLCMLIVPGWQIQASSRRFPLGRSHQGGLGQRALRARSDPGSCSSPLPILLLYLPALHAYLTLAGPLRWILSGSPHKRIQYARWMSIGVVHAAIHPAVVHPVVLFTLLLM